MSIKVKEPVWESMTLKSRQATVKAEAAISLKAGHPLFIQGDGTYKAYPVDTDLTAETVTGHVGVLGEDIDITDSDIATGVSAYVIFAGNVYVKAVRQAGISAENAPDGFILGLSADRTAITFIDYESKEAWA